MSSVCGRLFLSLFLSLCPSSFSRLLKLFFTVFPGMIDISYLMFLSVCATTSTSFLFCTEVIAEVKHMFIPVHEARL